MDTAELKISTDCFDVSTVNFHSQYDLSLGLLGKLNAVWILFWPCRHVLWSPSCHVFNDLVCSLGTGSLRRGSRCAQPSVACSLHASEFERNMKSPAACTLHTLDFSVSCFEVQLCTFPGSLIYLARPNWLAVRWSVLLGYCVWPFLPKYFFV